MKIALVQTTSINDRPRNLLEARKLMEAAITQERPDMLALPEVFSFRGGTQDEKRANADDVPPDAASAGPSYEFLAEFSRTHRVFVHGGSIFERIAGDTRVHNTTFAFDREGREIARYRKIHLFDVTAPDGSAYLESALVKAGDQVVTYQADGLTIGCTICYDIRFAALFTALAARKADVIMVPAAFTLATGKDHWEVLLRARAIETQAYIVAPAQYGPYPEGKDGSRHSYGHSLAVDPWGHVIARASDGAGFASMRVDQAQIARVRGLIPMSQHRKPIA